jgi:hypothetical protein
MTDEQEAQVSVFVFAIAVIVVIAIVIFALASINPAHAQSKAEPPIAATNEPPMPRPTVNAVIYLPEIQRNK